MSVSSSPNSYSSVVVAGASGFLGSQIVKQFLEQSNVKTHILVRKGSEHKVEELVKLGAHLIEGDVVSTNLNELVQSLKGIDVIVSALSGDESVLYDGQLKLLNAAKLSGVKKFIPSCFGVNFEYLQFGDVFILDPKKKFLSDLKNQTEVDYLSIHNSLFYNYAFYPGFLFEKENDTVKYFGDLNEKIQLTDTTDVAKYTVQASLNPQLKNRSINIAGDERTFKELILLKFGSENVKFEQVGSAQDLKNNIQQQIHQGIKPEQFLPLVYQQLKWVVVSGIALPPRVDNDLFTNISPLSLDQYVKKQ